MAHRAVVALGSNLGDRERSLALALAGLGEFPETRLAAASEVEETEPEGVSAEFAALKFLNQVAIFDTELEVFDFSRRMHRLEDELGRVRTVRNGPRTIDLDLIDYDGLELASAELTLPHPRANERAFVREPWKTLLRREMKAHRAAVPAAVRAAASHELCQRLSLQLEGVSLVCAYAALAHELDLAEFIALCRRRGIEVVFPERQSVAGGAAIYTVASPERVDLWVCPGLAFTARGERLGFGGGWYDRLLAAARADARTLGVGYGFQLLPSLPQGPFDRRLGAVLTV